MSDTIRDLARKKMQEAKKKAKEAEKQAREVLKNKSLEEKIRRQQADMRARQKEQENKEFAKRVQKEILNPHYRHSAGEFSDVEKGLYIFKLEDGNIVGKNGDEYFYSYQRENQTIIKTFVKGEERRISDGDHYPTFMDVETYKVKSVAINFLGAAVPSSVRKYETLSMDYMRGEFRQVEEFNVLESMVEKADEHIAKVRGTSPFKGGNGTDAPTDDRAEPNRR